MIFCFYYLIENYANFNFCTHGTSEEKLIHVGILYVSEYVREWWWSDSRVLGVSKRKRNWTVWRRMPPNTIISQLNWLFITLQAWKSGINRGVSNETKACLLEIKLPAGVGETFGAGGPMWYLDSNELKFSLKILTHSWEQIPTQAHTLKHNNCRTLVTRMWSQLFCWSIQQSTILTSRDTKKYGKQLRFLTVMVLKILIFNNPKSYFIYLTLHFTIYQILLGFFFFKSSFKYSFFILFFILPHVSSSLSLSSSPSLSPPKQEQ